MKNTVQCVLLMVPVNLRKLETSNAWNPFWISHFSLNFTFRVKAATESITTMSMAPERIKFSFSVLVLRYQVAKWSSFLYLHLIFSIISIKCVFCINKAIPPAFLCLGNGVKCQVVSEDSGPYISMILLVDIHQLLGANQSKDPMK
jgi:hypothetical protein